MPIRTATRFEHSLIGTRRKQPQRLMALLATLAAKRERAAVEVESRIAALQSGVSDAEEKLARLYKLVEDGVTDPDDILRARIFDLKLDRERAKASLDRAVSANHRPIEISPVAVEAFGRTMRENITTGEVPFGKAWLRSVVERIEVDDAVVRIIGGKATLEDAIAG